MKTTLLLLLMLAASLAAGAQYQVQTSHSPYSDLTGAPDLYYYDQDSGYYFNTDFMFKTFDRYYANFNPQLNPYSVGGFMDSHGDLVSYDSVGKRNTVVYQCFMNFFLTTLPGTTTAAAKMEGSAGNRILKFQWKNLVYNRHAAQTANFQIWLHEADGSISYHFGPNTLPPATTVDDGGYTGIFETNASGTGLLAEINLEGKPTSPAIYRDLADFALPTLDTIPPNGTVYTFTRSATAVAASATPSCIVFPNPAGATLHLSGVIPAGKIAIYDVAGRLIKEAGIDRQNNVDIRQLPSGTYTIQLHAGNGTYTRRFIKE